MSQKIFNLDLPVETISVYLLSCSLSDAGTAVSFSNLLNVWNSSEAALQEGIDELEKRRVIVRIVTDSEDSFIYRVLEDKDWRTDCPSS